MSAKQSESKPNSEHFLRENEYVALNGLKGFYEIALKPGARVESEFCAAGQAYPGTWRFGNVYAFAFDAFTARDSLGAFAGNLRAKSLIRALEEIGGSLPAVCEGNPYLYVLAKRGESGLAIGLWNLFEDAACGYVRLDREYARLETFGTNAHLEGTRLVLDAEIAPWSFALFALTV